MKQIYLAHSTKFDYLNNIYKPIINSELWQKYIFRLPHLKDVEPHDSKTLIFNECDILVAEVSLPSTGLGIELGWAECANKPIIALYKKGYQPSSSLLLVCKNIIEYIDSNDFIVRVQNEINKLLL
jgi:hypothetical protein